MNNDLGHMRQSRLNRFRVALLIQTATDWSRQVLSGIARFADERGGWDFYLEPRGLDEQMALPSSWAADGAIVRLTHPGLRTAIVRRKIPAVNVAWLAEHSTAIPKVVSDEKLCGELAAEYFLKKGYDHFAFVGPRREGYSVRFLDAIQSKIGTRQLHRYQPEIIGTVLNRTRLTRWLKDLPKPVALIAWEGSLCHDIVLSSLSADLTIPDDIAVLCLEADPLVSSLCLVPLSFVDQDGDAVGYRAAAALEQMMYGYPSPPEPLLIPPLKIVERLSTDYVAVADPLMKEALKILRERAPTSFSISDLEKILELSRRQLEHLFLKQIEQTPSSVLRNIRLGLAKDLLRKTELPLDAIAVRSGFQDASAFIRCFHRNTGKTPGEFRKSLGKS